MAKKTNTDDNFETDDFFDDVDFIEPKYTASSDNFTARRRLEQLREERELERILNSSNYDDYA